MAIKRCASCRKPAYSDTSIAKRDEKWLCAACKAVFAAKTLNDGSQAGRICQKCKNVKLGRCRFSAQERQRITACSDWEGRDTERNRRRWAKFEQD